jgi:uncharacterized protein (TIGR02300 family)
MAKAEWGTKRVCPDTGKRFYDLNKVPIVSPYTGNEIGRDALSDTIKKQAKEVVKPKESKFEASEEIIDIEDDDIILEDEEESSELDDGLLEEDPDTVPLEDITDVPTNDSDEN